ncbi:MAG: YdeI/OmpD-associated family protein [Bacteroidetes bacterium]|nr:YdeI/OmpD-associated family protein [Bacteroidota bacterium]MBS1650000.1 YdeI/OmpD-associated family protein [Bacteroidota bacterium]
MYKFTSEINIIGINPFVFVPIKILEQLFKDAGKSKGFIPVCGTVNKVAYIQTLVKYKGEWRLYINTSMLKNSPKRIGESIEITIKFDTTNRTLTPHPKLINALLKNKEAKKVFDNLSPSKQKEIVRYISSLKTENSINLNIAKAINFLLGKNKFVGRDKP